MTSIGPAARGGRSAALVVVVVLVACVSGPPEPPSGTRYEVRGVARDLTGLEGERRRLTIEHEAIEDFVGIDGGIEGMESMTMTMALWEGVSLPEDLRLGSPVAFVLDVDWERSPTALVVAIATLPEGTELELRDAD